MSYSETTSESWFSRLGSSIKGILFGIVIIPLAIVLIFWNEKREVDRTKTLEEGAGAVVSINVDAVDSSNEGNLVHVTGTAETTDTVTDEQFGVTHPGALKIKRHTEYYQYKEESRSETKKKLGGGTETVTTYDYKLGWNDSPIDSSTFKDPDFKNKNTVLVQINDADFAAKTVTLGAFKLSGSQIGNLAADSKLTLDAEMQLPDQVAQKATVTSDNIYFGQNSTTPAIGDVRVAFTYTAPGEYSVIAQQNGDSFVTYQAEKGTLSILKKGAHSVDALFAQEASSNKTISWIIRVVGFVLIAIGFGAILKPLSVVLDVIPLLGNIAEIGTGFLSLVLSFGISSVTIAIAWLTFRPLIGVTMLVLAGGAIYLLVSKRKKQQPA